MSISYNIAKAKLFLRNLINLQNKAAVAHTATAQDAEGVKRMWQPQ